MATLPTKVENGIGYVEINGEWLECQTPRDRILIANSPALAELALNLTRATSQLAESLDETAAALRCHLVGSQIERLIRNRLKAIKNARWDKPASVFAP